MVGLKPNIIKMEGLIMNKNTLRRLLFAVVMTSLVVGLLFSSSTFAKPLSNQTTTFINVGEGDSALLQDGNGFSVLIDGGKPGEGPVVDQFLHLQSITHLNVLMASHADSDHIGGLIIVLQDNTIQVDQVIYNGYPGTTATWDDFSSAVTARGLTLTPVNFPEVLTWGNMTAHILNPASGLTNPDTNDASIVARVDYGSTDYLFTGDINSTIEATVVARGTSVAAGVLKVPHHGSAYSSGDPFLAAVQPKDGIISVGPNSYGHPSDQTITRLINAGAHVWRTDLAGNIEVVDNGTTYNVNRQYQFLLVYLPFISKPFPPTETPVPSFTATPTLTLETIIPTLNKTNTPTITPTLTPSQAATTVVPPPTGANVICYTNGAAQICAWVSNANPTKNSTVTVYGRLLINNAGQANQTMTATWHYKSSSPTCTGTTDTNGNASCSRSIGTATSGYKVNVDVSIGGNTATTWFTPQ
jgi:competence protein ComEC